MEAKVRKIALYNCLVIGLVHLVLGYNAIGQNLVPDPGFEKLDHCPDKGFKNQSTLKALSYWWCPNKTSPDCMSKCAGGMDGLINNVGGSQDPFEGNSYVGICHGRKGRYYEFLQTQLTQKLEKGKTYLITLHVSFGDKVFFATNEIGVCLSKEKISEKGKGALPVNGYIPVRIGGYYKDKEKWMTLSALYESKGEEEYFTIGYFNPYLELQLVGNKKAKAIDGEADDVYYFIDDVSVEETDLNGKDLNIPGLQLPPPVVLKGTPGTFQPLRLVSFENGKTILLAGSFGELDSLASLLREDSQLNLEIGLYLGSDKYVPGIVELLHRLNAIRDYLISKGIHPKRIVISENGVSGSALQGTYEPENAFYGFRVNK